MAQVFKRYTGNGTTTGGLIYTVPATTTGIIIGLTIANTSASQITVSAQLNSVYIVKDAPLPSGSAISVLDGRVVGETGDTITVTASANSVSDVIVSVLEQSQDIKWQLIQVKI